MILIVDVVSDTDKFPFLVRASHKDDRDTQQVLLLQLRRIGCIGLQDELVDADRYRSYQNFIKNLIATRILGTSNIQDLPLEVVIEFLQAFKRDLELKRVGEAGRVVQDDLKREEEGGRKQRRLV